MSGMRKSQKSDTFIACEGRKIFSINTLMLEKKIPCKARLEYSEPSPVKLKQNNVGTKKVKSSSDLMAGFFEDKVCNTSSGRRSVYR